MTEEFRLTGKERAAARLALAAVGAQESSALLFDKDYVVQRIVDAINIVRRGDPLGTVRYEDAGQPTYAIRVDRPNQYRWALVVFHPKVNGNQLYLSDDEVDDWLVVYTPPEEEKE